MRERAKGGRSRGGGSLKLDGRSLVEAALSASERRASLARPAQEDPRAQKG